MLDHNFHNAYISLFQKYCRCWPKNSLDMFLFVKCFMAGRRAVAAIKIGLSAPPPPYPQPTRKALLRSPLPPLFQIFEIFQDLVWKGCLTCVVQVTREAIVKCKLYYSLPLPILCYKSIIIGSSPKCWWTQQCRFLKLQVNAMGHWSIFVWLLNSHVFSKLKFMLWMKFPF